MDLPEEFLARMRSLLGEEYEDFAASYKKPSPLALRLNTLKAAALPECCFERVPWCGTGAYYAGAPGKSALHEAGAYYIQEPSAMAVVTAARIKPGEKVLDLCAAPGGKSTHAACFAPQFLISNEIVPARARILAQNMERCGVKNCAVTCESPAVLADKWGAVFDAVIADVPCSGEGMFRRREIAVEEWSEENCAMCARRDREILHSAARLTAPGGRIIYSTCTFDPQENEGAVEKFLAEHAEFSLAPITALSGVPGIVPGINGVGCRLYPHKLKGEGHFVCVLKKAEGAAVPYRTQRKKADKKLASLFERWAQDVLAAPFAVSCDHTAGEALYMLPDGLPALDGIKCLRPGLPLGTAEKGRFVPHHSLAMALAPAQALRVLDLPADQKECLAFLHGETLPCALENGWTLVTTNGISLGWGKAVDGVLKNFYPKGLRK